MWNWGASFSILAQPGVAGYIGKGVIFTLAIAVSAVLVSIVWGSVLALVRNYCAGKTAVLKWLAVAYIEIFRNTPLLLWIFVCLVFCPCPAVLSRKMLGLTSVEVKILFRAFVALVLFTSSVIAEIIRGGLNAIPKGQFEAAHSQGFGTVQTMVYIILPQAFRAVVPTLLSQVITTIKDSSYLANVAAIELMARVRQILSTSNRYNGAGTQLVSDVFVLFGVAAVIYFLINFTLSCVVRAMNKRRPQRARRAKA
ncbi:MAG: amino acid ABC transporter permease [Gemmiger sp.]